VASLTCFCLDSDLRRDGSHVRLQAGNCVEVSHGEHSKCSACHDARLNSAGGRCALRNLLASSLRRTHSRVTDYSG